MLAQPLIAAIDSGDFMALSTAEHAIIKAYFGATTDSQGFVSFWRELLKSQATEDEYQKVMMAITDTHTFADDIRCLLIAGYAKAKDNPNIKALYYEYYYDGSDYSTGNLFLCTRFDETGTDQGDWASCFDELINGMVITPYFAFDDDFKMSNSVRHIAMWHNHATLLDAALQVLKDLQLSMSFGFASHDNPDGMIVVMP